MNIFQQFVEIKKAVNEGCRIHTFRSGGGLRVVRIEDDHSLRGYGEHPHIGKAFKHAEEDLAAGQRSYRDVYGPIYPHYLTGSSNADCFLDAWTLKGYNFDLWKEGNHFTTEMKGFFQLEWPQDLCTRVKETDNPETFSHRGWVIEVRPFIFPGDGTKGVSGHIIHKPEESPIQDPFLYQKEWKGEAETIESSIEIALQEVKEDYPEMWKDYPCLLYVS